MITTSPFLTENFNVIIFRQQWSQQFRSQIDCRIKREPVGYIYLDDVRFTVHSVDANDRYVLRSKDEYNRRSTG